MHSQSPSNFKRAIFIIVLVVVGVRPLFSQVNITIYTKNNKLTTAFVAKLCAAARYKIGVEKIGPTDLESDIIFAAGTIYGAEDQAELSFKWHTKYGSQCQCPANGEFEAGDILRQVVNSNFREFANIIGPKNRLPLDLSLKDPVDGMTILEYINNQRVLLEKKHDNDRSKFQEDIKWRNIMFFYFLFSEYSIN